jgi:hypothetical protein
MGVMFFRERDVWSCEGQRLGFLCGPVFFKGGNP